MSSQRLLRFGLAALFAALFVMIGYTGWAYSQLSQPYAGWEGQAADVLIEPGLDAGGLLERLGQAGLEASVGRVGDSYDCDYSMGGINVMLPAVVVLRGLTLVTIDFRVLALTCRPSSGDVVTRRPGSR